MQIIKEALIKGIFFCLSHLPLSLGRSLGRLIGWLFWLVPNNYNRKVTLTNIRLCFPELSPAAQKQLAKDSLQQTGMLMVEVAGIWKHPWEKLKAYIIEVEGREQLDRAIAANKGVILLAPHLGNWEIIGEYMSEFTEILNLYEPPSSEVMHQIIHHGRTKSGQQLAPTNQRGIAALLKHLRKGKVTGILPDQVPESRDRGGVYAPFFKHPAYTMTLASQLIQKTGCRAVFVVAERIEKGYKMHFVEASEAVYHPDETTSVTAINQMTEALVRQMPAQYQWEYKRFKRQPEGNRKVYS